jgi:hypothetical protein
MLDDRVNVTMLLPPEFPRYPPITCFLFRSSMYSGLVVFRLSQPTLNQALDLLFVDFELTSYEMNWLDKYGDGVLESPYIP